MDLSTATRANGPMHGAWPEAENGTWTGRYFYVVTLADGERAVVTKSEWKQAKVVQ